MKSIKNKLLCLGMAVAMMLGATSCAMSTPASVGTIGGVEIPAGVYLLAQYNAYNTASGFATLATDETASDVKAVLKAECTGTIGDEEVTTDGKDFVARVTDRSIRYYAAVENKFNELGATLDDAATSEVASTADSLWEQNGDLYTANGISKASVQQYLTNSQKAQICLDAVYGENGTTPVTEAEYTDYLENECYYMDTLQLPLMDYSTYAFADADQTTTIDGYADEAVAMLNEAATAETAATDVYTSLYTTASVYLPQAMAVLGSTASADDVTSYIGSQLFTPSDLSSFDGADGSNTVKDALDAAGMNVWTKVNLGTSILVARRVDALEVGTVDEYVTNYGLLTTMKSDDFQNELYADGAALEANLNQGAMNTYSASKIKKTV